MKGKTLKAKKAIFRKYIFSISISIITAPIRAQHTNKIIPPFSSTVISFETGSLWVKIGLIAIKKSNGASPIKVFPTNQMSAEPKDL
jgi:hypothetical protein